MSSLRWLVELFDLEFDVGSTAVDWSRLLERVAERLAADVEPRYSAKFPWPLWHLWVLGGRGGAVGEFRAVWSWSTFAARLTSSLMLMVVCGSELIHVSVSVSGSQATRGSSMIACSILICSPR